MDDLYRAFDDRAQVILHGIDSKQVGPARRRHRVHRPRAAHDVAAHRSDAPDVRRGAGREVRRLDRARSTGAPTSSSARCSTRVEPGTPVLVVSDHGFHSWRKAVNLNTWLVSTASSPCRGSSRATRSSTTSSAAGSSGRTWTGRSTRAYAMGLGQIYFNLRGREGQGIVAPGRGVQQLCRGTAAQGS